MMIVAIIITEASEELDRQTEEVYGSFVESSLQQQAKSLGQQALDYAWWDQSIEHLLKKPDADWADNNIGSYLQDKFNISVSLVVLPDNQFAFGFIDSEQVTDLSRFNGNVSLQWLIDSARRMSLDKPQPVSGLAMIDGQLHIIGAFPFTPERSAGERRSDIYLSVLVLMQRLNDEFIQQHAKDFGLQLGVMDYSFKSNGLILKSVLNKPLAVLPFRAPRPGEALLERMIGPMLGLTLIFLLLFFLSTTIIAKVSKLNATIESEKEALTNARAKLQQAYDQMEGRVEQRTLALKEEIEQRKQAEQELIKTEYIFQTLTNEAPSGILVHRHGQPLYANPALLALFNMDSFAQIEALDSTLDLWSEKDQKRVKNYHEARLRGENAAKEYTLASHPDFGPQRQLFNRSFRIEWEGGSAVCTMLEDITDRLKVQRELQETRNLLEQRVLERTHELGNSNLALSDEVRQHEQAQQQLRLSHEVLNSTSEAVVITDKNGSVEYVNEAYCQLTGYSREQMLGSNPRIHKSGRHDKKFYEDMWSALIQDDHWRGEVWDRRKNGQIYPKWLSISAVKDDNASTSHFVGVFSDITDRKDQQERLERLAHYDPLTGLPNRLLFKERVKRKMVGAERDAAKRTALLFIDLDHFKHVNDSLGHAAGDHLLVEVANRINHCLRSSDAVGRCAGGEGDHVVARMGGDEFTVALDCIESTESVAVVIERLRNALEAPVVIDDQDVFVSASIGVSIYPDDGSSYEQLVKNADKAMYRSKKGGRNQFNFFSAEMDSIANRRIELESGLRKALSEENFILHYQPQIDVGSGLVTSVETLIRWQHPDKGLIPPGDFIQVAEDTGLIVAIGEWVFLNSCKQVMHWNRTISPDIKLAVNLSARQFKDPELLQKIMSALKESGLPPQRIELEVTESVMIDDIDEAVSTLNKIRETGISVAIDDFGTGFSSLSYLRKLPVDTLKVDRGFTAKINQDDKVAAIVETIIHLGKRLNLNIVAEGVETLEQSDLLQVFGCDNQQGFLFSRPLSVADAEKYLSRKYLGDC
ncbi:MAG: EAL domain-containing protein [Motiliproteus sp.]